MLYSPLRLGVLLAGAIAFVVLAGWFFAKDRSLGGIVIGVGCLLVAGGVSLYVLLVHALRSMS